MRASAPIKNFAAKLATDQIRKFAFVVNRVASQGDADSVHDLRVAIRRLSQCLTVFDDLFPSGAGKKIRRRIRNLRRLANDVRNCDIAIEYLKGRSLKTSDGIDPVIALSEQRKASMTGLRVELRRWQQKEPWRKWRTKLEGK